jgi:hypothetical protein
MKTLKLLLATYVLTVLAINEDSWDCSSVSCKFGDSLKNLGINKHPSLFFHDVTDIEKE